MEFNVCFLSIFPSTCIQAEPKLPSNSSDPVSFVWLQTTSAVWILFDSLTNCSETLGGFI